MSFKTDFARVAGLGSAKDGTHHFWAQRLSAIALIILTPLFVIPLAINMGTSFEEVRSVYAHPFRAIVAGLFIATAFYHLKLGLQVVIEDYVSGAFARTAAIVVMNLFCYGAAFTGLFAVAKIAFSA